MHANDIEEEVEENEKPRFVIIEISRLEKLLQRCPDCGNLPGGPRYAKGQSRNIKWTKRGYFDVLNY